MTDKRACTPREAAAFALFAMAEDGAWSDGALHEQLARAGLSGRDAALAARLVYGTVQNELLLDWYLRQFSSVRLKKNRPARAHLPAHGAVPADSDGQDPGARRGR